MRLVPAALACSLIALVASRATAVAGEPPAGVSSGSHAPVIGGDNGDRKSVV